MVVARTVEDAIAPILRAQHACITWAQLLNAGWTPAQIRSRVRNGRFRRVHQRVYVDGEPDLIPLAYESAALLSLPKTAHVSHRSAAAMWSMATPDQRHVTVSLPGSGVRQRPGVRIHLVADFDHRDLRTRDGLRVTAPARSVIDFADEATADELEHAIADGLAHRYLSEEELLGALSRVPANHHGAAMTRAMLRWTGGPVETRSHPERKLRQLVAAAGLPPGLYNAAVHGFTVDAYWPAAKLVVEVDGFATHGGRTAFERDRQRDQLLTAVGLQVLRFTARQLEDEPFAVIARIAQALAIRQPA